MVADEDSHRAASRQHDMREKPERESIPSPVFYGQPESKRSSNRVQSANVGQSESDDSGISRMQSASESESESQQSNSLSRMQSQSESNSMASESKFSVAQVSSRAISSSHDSFKLEVASDLGDGSGRNIYE